VLFATTESKDSNRPFETIELLATALGLPIDQHFADDAYGDPRYHGPRRLEEVRRTDHPSPAGTTK
jgi:hypothetical protein